MKGQQVGYIRLSSSSKKERHSVDVELDRIFTDKTKCASCKPAELAYSLNHLGEGDSLLDHCIDCIARNRNELQNSYKL